MIKKQAGENKEYFNELVECTLKSGKNLCFKAAGMSMHPFIKNGQVIIVKPAEVSKLKVGDVVFFKREKNEFAAHRLILKLENGNILAKGDACKSPDKEVTPSQVLGKVIAVEKNGKEISLEKNHAGVKWRLVAKASSLNILPNKLYQKALSSLKPILYSCQKFNAYQLIARYFNKHLNYGVADAYDSVALRILYRYWLTSEQATELIISSSFFTKKNKNTVKLIVKKKDKIIGAIMIGSLDEENPEEWLFWGLVLKPRYRGRRIEEEIIKHALLEVEKQNGKKAKVFIDKQDKKAFNLYKNLGFVRIIENNLDDKSDREKLKTSNLLLYELSRQ